MLRVGKGDDAVVGAGRLDDIRDFVGIAAQLANGLSRHSADAIFEVSQPRVTCYRVGIRLNQPDMPSLLVSHQRSGFYFRVIQEGEVRAEDGIEKIAEGPEHMTVAEIDALLYSAHHPAEALRGS